GEPFGEPGGHAFLASLFYLRRSALVERVDLLDQLVDLFERRPCGGRNDVPRDHALEPAWLEDPHAAMARGGCPRAWRRGGRGAAGRVGGSGAGGSICVHFDTRVRLRRPGRRGGRAGARPRPPAGGRGCPGRRGTAAASSRPVRARGWRPTGEVPRARAGRTAPATSPAHR